MSQPNLNRMSYFTAVVEAGSITGAANALGISKAVVSKQVLLLEEEIGTALLHRNTRHLHPTDAGLRFYEQAKAALSLAEEAFTTATSGKATPEGRFRLTAPLDYGTLHLAPLAAQFVQSHPAVSFDLHLTDERLDPVEHQFDLSIRAGWLDDSANHMRKVGEVTEWLVGAPGIKVHHPRDLETLPFVANAAFKHPTQWRFTRGQDQVDVTGQAALRLNATPAIVEAVGAGGCVSVLPDFLCYDAVAQGRLVRLLPDWALRTAGIYAVTPPTRHKPLAIRRFIDMVAAYHKSGFGQSVGSTKD